MLDDGALLRAADPTTGDKFTIQRPEFDASVTLLMTLMRL